MQQIIMNLLPLSFVLAIGVNLLMFFPAYLLKTDKLTDISYAVSFILLAIVGAVSNQISDLKLLLLYLVVVWAFRLGSYLLIRVTKVGKDARFDDKRENFWSFLSFWLLQGVTVWIVMLPVTLVFSTDSQAFALASILGLVIWFVGLVIETLADWQKFKFKNDTANKGKWISSGVWKYSRHPNYLGEIVVWIGVYIFALPYLDLGQALIAAIGPAYIALLIIKVSGIPLLEKSADERWGKNPEYLKYKQKTSVLIPFIR